MHPKKIKILSIDLIKENDSNPRYHPKDQIQKLCNSIRRFGFINPILINSDQEIIAGHGRLQAAKRLKLKEVPTLCVDHLSLDEQRAYLLADNKLGELSLWDDEKLCDFLDSIDDSLQMVDYGFDEDLIDTDRSSFLSFKDSVDFDGQKVDESFDYKHHNDPIVKQAKLLTVQMGDMFKCGEHKIICGDSLKSKTYDHLLGDEKAPLLLTDPPYGVAFEGSIGHKLNVKCKKRKIKNIRNELKNDRSLDFFPQFLKTVKSYIDGAFYIFFALSKIQDFLNVFDEFSFDEYKKTLIWCKNHFNLSPSYYKNQFEPCVFGRVKDAKSFYWCGKKNKSDVLLFSREMTSRLHATPKPVNLFIELIQNSSKKHSVTLDPFGGSGTTMIACERTERKARLIEIEPDYVARTIVRWEQETGKKAEKIN